jgi:hypothetical protein
LSGPKRSGSEKAMAEPAVVLIMFRRPAKTARVLEVLRRVRPAQLFVLADAPRPTHPQDDDLCARTRALIDTIDWPCLVHRHYATTHLGLAARVISGLNAVFEQVEEAIILEDDCLPTDSFFPFCRVLLERFRSDSRVVMINGSNPLERWRYPEQSYHFSAFGCHWGWATWRRAWQRVDFTMHNVSRPGLREELIAGTGLPELVDLWLALWRATASGRVDTWDGAWTLSQLCEGGLAVVPARNLISNIGMDHQATNTVGLAASQPAVALFSLPAPFQGPAVVAPDRQYDRRIADWRVGRPAAEDVLRRIDSLQAEGRAMAALLLAQAFKAAALPASADQRLAIEARATAALSSLRLRAKRPGRPR